MLVVDINGGDLRARYVAAACGVYPFSSLNAVARHSAWLVSYAECGDLGSARVAANDIEAIRAELAED
jgi:hypothetical protein